MTAELLLDRPDAQVWHADWRDLLDVLPRRDDGTVCDSLIVDAPYSERTHSGHDGGERHDGSCVEHHDPAYGSRKRTRGINYAPWSAGDVESLVAATAPLCSGWMVSITDDVLAPVWRSSMEVVGRTAFAPVPLVEIGSRVRLAGDGPCSWSCYLVVSRPRNGEWLRAWQRARASRHEPRSLPGAYVLTGRGDREVMGGKTSDAMGRIVADYSEPRDLVLDPCCGGGTAGVAAVRLGRRFIGGDQMREHALLAAKRIGPVREQRRLFDEVGP